MQLPNDIEINRQETLRAFPELAVYHLMHYVKIVKVHQTPGLHTRLKPMAAVDLQFVDHHLELIKDVHGKPIPVFQNVELSRSSRHLTDSPEIGDYCLLCFPHGMANTAVVLAVLYENQTCQVEEKKLKMHADDILLEAETIEMEAGTVKAQGDEIKLGSAEDHAVLFSFLQTFLEQMGDILLTLGLSGNLGGPLPNHPTALAAWTTLKATMETFKSDIQLGKLTRIS